LGKLTSNPRLSAAALIAVAILFISFLGGAVGAGLGLGFLGGPIPLIQLPAEYIVEIGAYQLMNTYVMFWLAILVLVVLTFLATRKMSEVPGRWQGMFEAFFEFFITLAEVAAGGRRGRMFLPVVTAIFLGVIASNWLGTLPGVGTIGRIESVEEFLEIKIAKELKAHGDTELAKDLKSEGLAHFLETRVGDHAIEEAIDVMYSEHGGDKFVIFNGSSDFGLIPLGRGEDFKVTLNQVVQLPSSYSEAEIQTFIEQAEHPNFLPGVEHEELTSDDLSEGRVGLLVPYFRGASTDLNTTLAIAIFAMVSVQFWGFKQLGFKGYGGKFIFNPIKKPIDAFVGVLELIGEFIKVISFTFRLFGNMFAGEILLIAMGFLLPLIGIIPFLGLELFVGAIQAAIFSVLTLIFGSLAIIAHEHGDHDDEEEGAHAPVAVGAGAEAQH
jgi:F-type H+-transporting ATPase subunit a